MIDANDKAKIEYGRDFDAVLDTYQGNSGTIDLGVTGRELILKAAGIASVSVTDAERIIAAIRNLGYICVPRVPTELMIRNAWADALGEDAKGVWDCMIEASEDPTRALENLNW